MFYGYLTDDASAFSGKRSLEVVSGPKWTSLNSDFRVKHATVASKNVDGGHSRSERVAPRAPSIMQSECERKKKTTKEKTKQQQKRQDRGLWDISRSLTKALKTRKEKKSVQKEDVATLDTSCAWKAKSGNRVRCAPHKTQFCMWRFNRQIEIQPKNVFSSFLSYKFQLSLRLCLCWLSTASVLQKFVNLHYLVSTLTFCSSSKVSVRIIRNNIFAKKPTSRLTKNKCACLTKKTVPWPLQSCYSRNRRHCVSLCQRLSQRKQQQQNVTWSIYFFAFKLMAVGDRVLCIGVTTLLSIPRTTARTHLVCKWCL